MYESAATCAFLVGLAAASGALYDHRGRRYAEGKPAQIACDPAFRWVYAWVRATTIAATLGALLHGGPAWLLLHDSSALRFAGVLLAGAGFAAFWWAKRSLGGAYSPCFDSWVPGQIVERGAYARIRHPIYTANLMLLAGFALATGSAWVVLNFVLVGAFYVRAAQREEAALLAAHPSYGDYVARTKRFLP